jgi:hypothetical protein
VAANASASRPGVNRALMPEDGNDVTPSGPSREASGEPAECIRLPVDDIAGREKLRTVDGGHREPREYQRGSLSVRSAARGSYSGRNSLNRCNGSGLRASRLNRLVAPQVRGLERDDRPETPRRTEMQ